MYNLAKFYHYSFGTEIDKARALNFYKKAGMPGLGEAEYRAGMLLLTDEEIYNFDDGINWLQQASRKGQPNAEFLLGQNFFQGKDILMQILG
ncbi:sel1 repeat family protein [Colwellia sp. MB02u-10]|jgi:TPR repeat protein|uniref:tetratricopeptide repeat protein n=1 Tax=Colwellia sp. MB02u-10 TaxID=2759828 RepID=UPI0015F7160A|nr:SEL1-like repeat protein [Colwellia sp. MB02u-10]MBA6341769.1 sel1 repeat family protein [Colwellia sp. MB02u-10]